MKTANIYIVLGVLVAGLSHGTTPLHAEPASDPAPAGNQPIPIGGEPASTGEVTPADDDPIVIDEPDKPWNQGVSSESRAAARALFMEGNRLFRIPLFAKAAEKYMAALSTWKHPAIYFNLALAQLSLGRDVEARETLEHAVAYGPEPLGKKEFQEAQKQLQEVKRQLGRIRVTCRTQGAEVTLDGATLFIGPGSYEGWIKAKAHDLTSKKSGYQSEARRVQIPAGELQEIDLSLFTLTQATDISRRWSSWKPWAVVTIGSAIVVSGGMLHALSVRNFDAYDAKFSVLYCAHVEGCTKDELDRVSPGLNARLERANRQQMIAKAAYIAGGSVIVGGVILLYLNRPRLAEGGVGASVRKVSVIPAVSGDMLGVLMSMSH